MAVQNHLLSNTILIRPDDNDDSDSSLQGETMKVQVNIPFKYPSVHVESGSVRPNNQMEQWINVLFIYIFVFFAVFILVNSVVLIKDLFLVIAQIIFGIK